MVSSITSNMFYRTTDKIESNTLLNRGIVDVFGYAVPTAINANNKDEARERALASCVYFTVAFLSPLVVLPLANKVLLKQAGITKGMQDKGVEIVRLSKKYLVKDSKEMLKGLEELKFDLKNHPSNKTKEKFKNVDKDFQGVLDRFPDKEELREKLLKAHTKIAIADYVVTGSLLIAECFGVKELTKILTGRTGFSAEYKMAEDDYTKKNAQKHEQNKKTKILASVAIMLGGAVAANRFVQKSFLKQNPQGLMKWVKNNADKFNYTDGKFMRVLPYFLITLFGDIPPYLLSARDKYERRDSAARTTLCMSVFFGGDALLSGVFGRVFDKAFKTKLVNTEGLNEKLGFFKRATAPIYTLEELRKKTTWDKNLLKRTQKFGMGMYWLNLALVILTLGIAMPKVLNHILKRSVDEDLKAKQNGDKK